MYAASRHVGLNLASSADGKVKFVVPGSLLGKEDTERCQGRRRGVEGRCGRCMLVEAEVVAGREDDWLAEWRNWVAWQMGLEEAVESKAARQRLRWTAEEW